MQAVVVRSLSIFGYVVNLNEYFICKMLTESSSSAPYCKQKEEAYQFTLIDLRYSKTFLIRI